MTAQLAPVPFFRTGDNNNAALANGLLYSYAAGTSTPQATYVDSTQTTPNTNPVVLNARGEASVWLDVTLTYKLVLQDQFGNLIWTQDNVPGGYITASNFGIFLWPQTQAERTFAVVPTTYNYPPNDIRRYGADQTGANDSGPAIQRALNLMGSNSLGLNRTHIESFSDAFGGSYSVQTPAILSFAGALGGFPGLHWSGHGSWFTTPFLPAADFVMSVDNSGLSSGQQALRLSYSDLSFLSNGANTAGIFETTGALVVTVQNVFADSTGTLLTATNSLGGHVANCDVHGNNVVNSGAGVALAHQGNFSVMGYNCYGMQYGITALGSNSVASDGAPLIIGCALNGNLVNQIFLQGTYTPIVMGVAVEAPSSTTATITGITQAASAVITVNTVSTVNPFSLYQTVVMSSVVGMTQINGVMAKVLALGGSSGAWTVTVNVNSSAFTAYSSGGTIASANANIQWTNNQDGVLVGAYIGPGPYSLHMDVNTAISATINDHNVVGYITAQSPMTLDHLFCCQVGNITMEPDTGSANPDNTGAVWNLTNCSYSHFSDFNLHTHDSSNVWSIRFDTTTSAVTLGGGRMELPILFNGTTSTRSGGNIACPTVMYGRLVTSDTTSGLLRLDEATQYWNVNEGRWIQSSCAGPAGGSGQLNYQLPFTAASGTLGASGSTTFNVTSILKTPAGVTNGLQAEFMAFGGSSGSAIACKILCMLSNSTTYLTILSGGATIGSLQVTVSGSVITLQNSSGSVTTPYVLYLTKLEGY